MEYSESPWAEDRSGEVLAGRYKLIRRIGRGGMGSVYLGIHQAIQKKVAIKLLDGQLVGQADFASRFVREAQSASRLRHGNIVDVTDFGETGDGSVFLVMEYLEGEDLGATLEREHRLPWPRVKHIVLQVLRALHCAHEGGILHRDIKLENCFRIQNLSDHDFIKVLDFGNAKEIASHADVGVDVPLKRGRLQTAVGVIVGTAAYISPEQAQQLPLDARSDLYSVGVMIFELLTGRLPFEAATFMGVLNKHINDWPPTLREFAPDVEISAQVESLVAKLLAKTPDERYASAAKVAQAIQSIPDGTPMVGPSIWFAPPRKDVVDTRTLQVPAGENPSVNVNARNGRSSGVGESYAAEGRQHRGSVDQNKELKNDLRDRMDALAATAVLSEHRNGSNGSRNSADQLLRNQAQTVSSLRDMESNQELHSHGLGQSHVEFGPGFSNRYDDESRRKNTDREQLSRGEADIESELGGTSPLNTISRSSSRLSSRSIRRSEIERRRGSNSSYTESGMASSDDEFEFRTGWWSSIAASFRRLFGQTDEAEIETEPSFSIRKERTTIKESAGLAADESTYPEVLKLGSEQQRHFSIGKTESYSHRVPNLVDTSIDSTIRAGSDSKTTKQLDFQSEASQNAFATESVEQGFSKSDIGKDRVFNTQSSPSQLEFNDSGFVWEGVPSRDPSLRGKKFTEKFESEKIETIEEESSLENSDSSNQAAATSEFAGEYGQKTSRDEAKSDLSVATNESGSQEVDADSRQLEYNSSIGDSVSSSIGDSVSASSGTENEQQETGPVTDFSQVEENQVEQAENTDASESKVNRSTDVYDSRRVEDEWDEILDKTPELDSERNLDQSSAQTAKLFAQENALSSAPNAAAGVAENLESQLHESPSERGVASATELPIEEAGVREPIVALDSDREPVVESEKEGSTHEANEKLGTGESNPETGKDSFFQDDSSKVVAFGDESKSESEKRPKIEPQSLSHASSLAMIGVSSESKQFESVEDVAFEVQRRSHRVRNWLIATGATAAVLVAIFGIVPSLQVTESSEKFKRAENLVSAGVKKSSLISGKNGKTQGGSLLLESRSRPDLDILGKGKDSSPNSRSPSNTEAKLTPLLSTGSNAHDPTSTTAKEQKSARTGLESDLADQRNSKLNLVGQGHPQDVTTTTPNPKSTPSAQKNLNKGGSSDARNFRRRQKRQEIRSKRERNRNRNSTKPTPNSTVKRTGLRADHNKSIDVQLSSAMNSEVRQCGRKFGGFPGDRIELRFEVQASGTLNRVQAKGKRVGHDLAACIESKLSGKKIKTTGAGKARQFVRL